LNRYFQFKDSEESLRLRINLRRLISLLFITGLLLVNQPHHVRASPIHQPAEKREYTFRIFAKQKGNDSGVVCIGDTVTFDVWISRLDHDGSVVKGAAPMAGIPITATVAQADILPIQSKNPLKTLYVSDNSPDSAIFKFQAEKDGYANIHFTANIPEKYLSEETRQRLTANELKKMLAVSVQTSLQVIQCPFEVKIFDRTTVRGNPGTLDMWAATNWTELKAEGGSQTYRGIGIDTILVDYNDGICEYSDYTGERAVEFVAQKVSDTDDRYNVSFNFGVARGEYTVTCPGAPPAILEAPFPDFPSGSITVGSRGGFSMTKTTNGGYTSFRIMYVRKRVPK
jgi:hypothetical protein